jgi:iron complex outermembrane receptor protein
MISYKYWKGAALSGILLSPVSLSAQEKLCTKAIPIIVENANNKEALADAHLMIGEYEGYTNQEGLVIIDLPCHYNWQEELISVDGYSVALKNAVMGADTIRLMANVKANTMHGVLVLGNKNTAKGMNAQAKLSVQDIGRMKGNSLAAMASQLAGVSMMQTGAEIAKPIINGMANNRILILNNGVRQEGQQWGAEHAPEIDAMQVDQLVVVKGAETVRYGRDAIGGVLLIHPEPLPFGHKKLHAHITAIGNTNGRKAIGDIKLENGWGKQGQWAWRLQGSGSKGGNYKTPAYFLNNTSNKSINYSLALGYKQKNTAWNLFASSVNNTVGIFKGAHIGDTLDLKSRIRAGRPSEDGEFSYAIAAPRQQVQHDLVKASWQQRWSSEWTLDASYNFQRDRRREFDIRRQDLSDLPSIDLTLMYQGLSIENSWKKNRWSSSFGFQGDLYVNNNKPNLHTTPIIPNYDSRGLGIYGISKYVGERFIWEAGLRWDAYYISAAGYDSNNKRYGSEKSFQNLNGSLGIQTNLFKRLVWKSNIGTAWRPPTANEWYSSGLHHGAAQYELGDSLLNPEQSAKWMHTFSWQPKEYKIQSELEVYLHYFQNYIVLQPTLRYAQSLRGAFPIFAYHQAQALFWGLDWANRWEISKKWNYELKWSLVRAKNRDDESYLPFIPADKISQTINYTCAQSKKYGDWGVWLKAEYTAQQDRYTPAADFAAPPDAYTLFGAGIQGSFLVGAREWQLYFTVDNLLNKTYKDYLNRYRYFAHDIGRNCSLKITYIL